MKAVNNGKIILLVRHIELLKSDKWHSKSILAFLTQLMTYHGFYDESSFEWIHVPNFQIIATCQHLKFVDSRFVSQIHIVEISVPSLEEVEKIFSKILKDDVAWKLDFLESFVKIMREIKRSESGEIETLRIGRKIIDSLERYAEVNSSVLKYEFWRSLQFQATSGILNSALLLAFGSKDEETFFISPNGAAKLVPISYENFSTQIRKTLTKWINETEVNPMKIGLISETVELFLEINNFLADDDKCNLKGLVLLGFAGCGRKTVVQAVAHTFGYDLFWTPKANVSEKQLIAELRNIFQDEEEEQHRKTVIFINEIHFQLISCLRDKLYEAFYNYRGNSQIRMVIATDSLSQTEILMWGRVCHVHKIPMWSEESMKDLPLLCLEEIKESKLSHQFYKLHQLFNQYTEQPRRFVAFIQNFASILSTKREALHDKREHLQLGVNKLDEANQEVAKLKVEATNQKELLAEKRQEADDALNLITTSMHGAEDQKVELEDIKKKTEKETAKLKVRKTEIDAELKEIEPTLQAAKAAVGGIKSESLAEIRSLRAPPEVIRDILEGVLRLMGVNDTSWVSMKSFLSRRGVKEEIMNFDSRKISIEMREKVESLLQSRGESYDAANAKRASLAGNNLCYCAKMFMLKHA